MPYRVTIASAAARAIRSLDRPLQVRIVRAAEALAETPRPAGTSTGTAEEPSPPFSWGGKRSPPHGLPGRDFLRLMHAVGNPHPLEEMMKGATRR